MAQASHNNIYSNYIENTTSSSSSSLSSTKTTTTMFLDKLSCVGNWQREQTLGSGSFAIITLWINKDTDQQIALKQNRYYSSNGLDQKYDEKWKQEINIMKQLKCENVVSALELPIEFQSLQLKTPILAMEYCSGGDLRRLLNKPENCCGLSEKEVRQILKQISSAIIYLHDLKIIHRDLKPENIVLQPLSYGRILYKLIDLGYAKQMLESTSTNSFVGTLEYLAPELFLGIKYTSAVDNWSFGLLAFEIITGRRPFLPNHSMADILEALKKKKSSFICTDKEDSKGNYYFSKEIPMINQISSTLKSDLEKWLRIVLEYDPAKRGGREAFQMIHDIMNKYKIQIYAIDLYETFPFEINLDTDLEDLKKSIFSSTNIIPKNQYLFFQNGDIPKNKIGKQIIETWYTPRSWFQRYNPIVIFMFDRTKGLHYEEFYKYLSLPSSVEEMLMDSDENINTKSFNELKLTWRYSILVVQQIVKKQSLANEALKSLLLNCLNMFNKLQANNQLLYNTVTEVFSSVNVIQKLIKNNFDKFKCNNDNSIVENGTKASKDYLDYMEIFSKLKRLYEIRKTDIGKHLEQSEQIVPKFDKETFMFEDFFRSPETNPSLMKKYTDMQNAYDSIRKRKKDELNVQSSCNLLIKLLCDCFKLVETLLPKIFAILEILGKFLQNINEQIIHCEQLQSKMNEWKVFKLEELLDLLFKLQKKKMQHTHHSDELLVKAPNPNRSPNIQRNQATAVRKSSQNEESMMLDRLILELETEDSQWKCRIFDFKKLEFCNFLF